MRGSVDALREGKQPVWGDVVEVNLKPASAGKAVFGQMRHVDTHAVTVGGVVFPSERIVRWRVTREVSPQTILDQMEMAAMARGEVTVTARWHGPSGGRPIWAARWEGVESKDRGILRSVSAFGHEPEKALRDLWWSVTTAEVLVWDAYGTKGGRREFRWDGLAGAWKTIEEMRAAPPRV